jgi:hypothetical protein
MESATKSGLEVGDDEFVEGDPAVLALDRVAAFDLLELEAFVEAPDIGVD